MNGPSPRASPAAAPAPGRSAVLAALAVLVGLAALAAPELARADPPVPGLVAAYAFDEAAGTVAADASGNGHPGSLVGAGWAPGRHGSAVALDGSSAYVALGSLGTFYQDGFTLQAWVHKTSGSQNDVAVLGTWNGGQGGPMLWVDHLATRYHLTLGGGLADYLDSGHSPTAGLWQHLAATYDGATARFYLDGVQVASRPVAHGAGGSNLWRIGAYGPGPGGFFDGLVDDVRIYDRALTPAEIGADMNTPVALADADAPTVPGGLRVTGRTKTSLALDWEPSADDDGVAGYTVYVGGAEAASTTETQATLTGLECGTSYLIEVEAEDTGGATSERAELAASTSLCGAPVGLVASYTFDEGAGTVAGDASGNGHAGSLIGAGWAPGRHGSAVALDGSGAYVALDSLGTFYQDGFTLQAWVHKTSDSRNDVAVLGTWNGGQGGPMLWVDHLATRYHLTLNGGLADYLDSGHNPTAGLWQHLAATYDGSTARFYLDGVQVASRPVTGGPGSSDLWRIGAYGPGPGGFFDGLVDDVRIYDRALTAAEINADKDQPVPPLDTTPPSAPTGLAGTGDVMRATLGWNAAEDDVELRRYAVHRSQSPGFAPSPANRIGHADGTSYEDTGLAPGTYYYVVVAEDVAGNLGPPSNQAAVAVAGDVISPTVTLDAPAPGALLTGTTTLAATASDEEVLAGVTFLLDGQPLAAEDQTAPFELAWDTRGATNGAHALAARARDAGGNTTTTPAVPVTVQNEGVSAAGLRAAYGLDDGSGTLARDSSGNHRTGTLEGGAGWSAAGRFDGAAALGGGHVRLPGLGTFYQDGFTFEAWVYRETAALDVAVVGTWTAAQGGGPMIWIDHVAGRYRLTLGHNPATYLDSGVQASTGRWEHVAATYDGATARIYVDGVEAASTPFTGAVGNSNTWRIGAYGTNAGGFFPGRIDNVRIYDRALTAGEIATDLASRVQPELTPPAVESHVPAAGATDVAVGDPLSVRFSEPMRASTMTAGAFELRPASGPALPLDVTYDAASRTANLELQGALLFGAAYELTVKAGVAADLQGNVLAADVTSTFTTESSPPPVLLVTSQGNPFTTYLGEILVAEGFTTFSTIRAPLLTPTLLSHFDVVVLGETPLTTAQVGILTSWVNAGGNLIAMRPDKKLAPLLGLVDAGTTLADRYLRVDTGTGPGAGLVGSTIQYHGTADRYTVNGTLVVASLYSTATAATANPAVTVRAVGLNGGQAAAFTYDLARSVVLTRQGNPAWAGQERDGEPGIRPSDMFYGNAPLDPQPDWIDTNKVAIPQADEQQRLLANLITQMNRDRKPLPRFWYLPRGEKAAVVLSGDDHSPVQSAGATASNFERLKELSPPGCDVDRWECVRSSSYMYPSATLTDAEAAGYVAEGFEVGLHPVVAACPTAPISAAELSAVFADQLAAFAAKYTSVPAPVSGRTHCVFWPDWASNARVELAHGIRLDANYYHYPSSWIGGKPGFMTGGGFPMRFAELDGTPIDVYQQNTNLTDESAQPYPQTIDALLDRALGPEGYYGAFGANIHTDNEAPQQPAEDIVASAQARGVPLVSYAQMLEWVDGRRASTVDVGWDGERLTFEVDAAAGADGLVTLVPFDGPAGPLVDVTRDGAPVQHTIETIKGIRYALVETVSGTYEALYDATPPVEGLVGAWGFEDGAGPTATDSSGTGNHGTISGALWSALGRYGGALEFDGTNDLVTVPDADSLDLTTGMTIEAWAYPTALGATWRTIALKERPGHMVYSLYAGADHGSPTAEIFAGSVLGAPATAPVPMEAWTHIAATYDGAELRLYVDGIQAASTPATAPIATSAGMLRFGGNTIWAEWFKGRLDEIRVYNRALSPAEIQTDMTQPIAP